MAARKRILYAFTGGRSARSREMSAGAEAPTEFLFGYSQLRPRYDVEMVEGDPSGAPQARTLDHALNHLAARVLGIGINTPAYLAHVPRLSACDCIVAVPDSVALAFARLKLDRRAPGVPLVYVAMGLAAGLRRRPIGFRWWRSFYARLLGACDAVVAVGRAEHDFLRELFPAHAGRLHFIPFGVDTAFWRPSVAVARDGGYLFVGNDPNRDFDMVRAIVRRRPDLRFRIVSSSGRLLSMREPNAEVSAGDWRTRPLSDAEMRTLYQQSAAVFLPLRETLQPSGQSVTLQALACGTPVAITRTGGFWDPERWAHKEHCYFVDTHDAADWSRALDELQPGPLLDRLATRGRALVQERYTIERFADHLADVIEHVTSRGGPS